MAEIVMEDVSKVYSDGTTAVSNLNLEIADGEFIVLVGPSGCGKTTALRMVAGLESVTSGTVRIGDRVVNDVPPKDRDIAMVFQNYALYPHMSVYDNMAFGLKLRKLPKQEIDRRVREAADILGLEELLQRKPKALSGGQRQRVAMGRAIVRQPQAFLMDEPLSNLDAKLRVQMRSEIARIQHDLGVTTIYVTHDQIEAMTMGDRVAVIRKGDAAAGRTRRSTLYDHPTNLFVAGFIGSPAMNLFEATLAHRTAAATVEFGGFRLAVPRRCSPTGPALAGLRGQARSIVGIRPEDMEDASLVPERRPTADPVAVELREALGSTSSCTSRSTLRQVITDDVKELATTSALALQAVEERARPERRLRRAAEPPDGREEGEPIELVVDTTGSTSSTRRTARRSTARTARPSTNQGRARAMKWGRVIRQCWWR